MNAPQFDEPLPARLAHRPRDHRGFIVPHFVSWFDDAGREVEPPNGTPDFRVINPAKRLRCIRNRHCWLCGQPLGRYLVFANRERPADPACERRPRRAGGAARAGGDLRAPADEGAAMRRCGDCQLCCKVLPTKEIDKPADTRCRHQKHGVGCAIYERRPMSCRLWLCLWLMGEPVGARPDRSRLVVDPLPDYVVAVENATGARQTVPVIQVWCAEHDREAHRDPAFREWLKGTGRPALVRFANKSGLVLQWQGDHWYERWSDWKEAEHTVEQKIAAGLYAVTLDNSRRADEWATPSP